MADIILLLILSIIILVLFSKYYSLKGKIEDRSKELFEDWKQREINQIKSHFESQSRQAIQETENIRVELKKHTEKIIQDTQIEKEKVIKDTEILRENLTKQTNDEIQKTEKLREQLKLQYDIDTKKIIQDTEILREKLTKHTNDEIQKTEKLREQLQKDNEKIKTELYEKLRLEKIEQNKKLEKTERDIENLQILYKEDLDTYNRLLSEKSTIEEDLELMSYGLYKPYFDFDTSEKYKEKMNDNYEKQKELTKNKMAIVCHTKWSVDGDEKEGQRMTNKNIKLISRAFNNECDATILKARWNNVNKMEERIKKAFDNINKLSESNRITITDDYLKLKLEELYLAHEYQQKLQAEKEEQRRIQEQIREEQKVQKELEDAQEEAEKEEDHYQKEIIRVKEEMEHAKQEELIKYQEKISSLEEQLKRTQENKEKAKSRAQLTKSGYIYIISNVGSFGEDVYKIGMTRRYDPDERIYELGGASVPFRFDKHALIYSDNAPALELKIQNRLLDKNINLTNSRKEFFKVKLDEIKRIIEENYGSVEFIEVPEAKEYRESLEIRKQIEDDTYITKVPENNKSNTSFPDHFYSDDIKKSTGVQQKIVENTLDPGTDENKKYSNAMIWIKEQINKSKDGVIRIKIKDAAKEFGLTDQNEDDIYHGLKDILFREGIIVDTGEHISGDKVLITRSMINYPNHKQK